MQPERQNNYWENDSDQPDSDKITEMYAPELDTDEVNQESQNKFQKPVTDSTTVHWSASEYFNDDKNGAWFVGFAVIVLAFIAVDIFILKSYTFSFLVLVMALTVIIFARRPPRLVHYTLSGDQGLYVGERLYHFSEFKAFGLIKDRGQHTLMLIPNKRFSPGVSVYFPEEAGEKIVDIFGARLPMENLKLDIIDIIVQKLRL